MEPKSATVSRTEEIRALFIFGLLAVLASFRVSNAQSMEVTFPYGTLNLLPIIDEIIVLWSLYAIFMIIGLSKDVIGNSTAKVMRMTSKTFLQISYIFLAIFLLPAGLVAYGVRFILMLLLIVVTLAIGLLLYLYKKDFGWVKIKQFFKNRSKQSSKGSQSINIKQILFVICAFIFSISTYTMLSYPEDAFAGQAVLFVCFILSACSISLILYFNRHSFDEEYTHDY